MHKHLDCHISVNKLEKEYLARGEAAFNPKPHPGNRFAALHRSKNLSELERLRLLVAKQEIEIAGSNKPYYHCLEVLKKLAGKKKEEQTPQVVLHTD